MTTIKFLTTIARLGFAFLGSLVEGSTAAATDVSLPLIYDDSIGDLRTETMAECVLISDAMNAALGVSASEVTCLAGSFSTAGAGFLSSCTDESVKRLNELGVGGIADGVYSAWSPLSCNRYVLLQW